VDPSISHQRDYVPFSQFTNIDKNASRHTF
jgi:hypothetical protein